MDIVAITNALRLSLENKATFLEHVETVSKAGAVRYLVDLSEGLVTYYNSNNSACSVKLNHAFELINNPTFSKEKLSQAILDIQEKKISYVDFLNRIYQAGVISYDVDILDGKVVYSGKKTGEAHIEPFPITSRNNL